MTTTADRVRKIIWEHLGVEDNRITPEAKLRDDLGADSLDHVELVMAFEEEFMIEISDAEAEKVETVGQAVAAIDRLLAENRAA